MITLTNVTLNKGRSKHGGWNKEQMDLLGVNWPLGKGWKRFVLGREFSDTTIEKFISLKDKHLTGSKTLKTKRIHRPSNKNALGEFESIGEEAAKHGILLKTANSIHWMFEDAKRGRLANYYPTTGTFAPVVGEKLNIKDPKKALEKVIELLQRL